MPKKYEKPVTLDLPFEDAMERYAQTDPAEVEEAFGIRQAQEKIDELLQAFEDVKHVNAAGLELWFARDLMKLFEYSKWQSFREVIEKAYRSCVESGINPAAHFAKPDLSGPWTPDGFFTEPRKKSQRGRPQENLVITRGAAYLIAENADSSKPPVAFAQRYFAEQTRRQELADEEAAQRGPEILSEDQRRVLLRDEVKEHNKTVTSAARGAGVETPQDFAIFHSAGYRGMYGGRNVAGIRKAKGLTNAQEILDHMGSTELAANLFRLTQTEEKLRNDPSIQTKAAANRTHEEVGRKVRDTMREISGVLPENLPPADHIRDARKRVEGSDAPKALPKPKAKPRAKKH